MIPKFKAWKNTNDPEMFEDIRAIDFEKNIIRIGYKLSEYTTRIDEESLDNVELLQSTGLKDKHGKEIYEEDIVQDEEGDIAYIVFLKKDMGYFVGYKNSDRRLEEVDDYQFEILGNIYEHPHLLEEE